MKESLFIEIVRRWFTSVATMLSERFNGEKEKPGYLHDQMLVQEYSPDLTWSNLNTNYSIIAADVVSMDAELPLKKRDSMGGKSGLIPKMGMKFSKGEKLLTDIRIMMAQGIREAQIVTKIFADLTRCVTGIKERVEMIFLEAISTGYAEVGSDENTGTSIRVDYGFLDKNKFGAEVKWGEAGYTPLSDIARVIEASKESITAIMLTRKSYNLIKNSDEGKVLSANFQGLVYADQTKLPTPTPTRFDEAFADEYRLKFIIVDRDFKIEKNGKRDDVNTFQKDTLVFLKNTVVGRCLYGLLAEETNPVAGVVYQKVGYILLSKFSKNDPLQEFTSSQALALPVIDGVDTIHLLNTQEVQTKKDAEVEGDATIEVYDVALNKADIISAFKTLFDIAVSPKTTDDKLIAKINKLSKADEDRLKQHLGVS